MLRQDPAVHTKLYFRTFLPTQEAALGLRKKFLALMRGDFDILLDEQGA